MKYKLILICFIVCMTQETTYAQLQANEFLDEAMEFFNEGKIDKAVNIWKKLSSQPNNIVVSDSIKMVSIMKLTQSYLLDYNSLDTTQIYLKRLEEHCKDYKENRCFVFKYSLESLYHEFNNDFISAIQSGKRGIDYVNKGGCDDLWYTAYSNYGYSFFQIGELEKAREQYIIASYASRLDDFQKLESTINISSTFENQPDSVLHYSSAVLSLCDTLQDIWLCPYVVNNVAFSLASLDKYKEAEQIIDQDVVKNNYLNQAESPIKARLNHTIGFIKSRLGKLDDGEEYLLNSLSLAREVGSKKAIRSSLKDLSILYEEKGDVEKSLKLMRDEAEISELIHTEDIQKELANYENTKLLKEKENQIDDLEEKNESISDTLQNMIKVALGLLLAMFIFGVFWIYRAQQNKIKFHSLNDEISLAKLQSLQVSMNPHFLFNTFATLQLFILENKSNKALEYLGSLSNLLRRILYNSKDVIVSINEEIDMLESYFYLEAERFDNDIDLNVSIDDKLTKQNPLIPAMILQPHLENAIHHGVSNSMHRGIIDVKFSEKNQSLFCTITDNGIGREASAIKKGDRQHLSTATKNTSSRIEILKKLGYKKSSMNVIDIKDNQGDSLGTRVEIVLPFIEQM